MTRFFLSAFGRLFAASPVFLLRGLTRAVGLLIYGILPGRRRRSLRALHGALPEISERRRRAILRESCARLVEMGLYLIASPFFSEKRLRATVEIEPGQLEVLREHVGADSRHPTVLLVPHFTLAEMLTVLPFLHPFETGGTAVIFRPVAQPALDAWVRAARERHGIKLVSRRAGFSEVGRCLEANGNAGVLFDQSAGGKGSLITMFERLASATELPGLLARRHGAKCFVFYPERTGFWRARLRFEPLNESTPIGIALAAHRWLERHLTGSDDRCADWLWLHDRWKCQDRPKYRFHLRPKRNRLTENNAFRGYAEIPRATRVWIRMPDPPDAALALVPLLRAVRAGRPDMALTLLAKGSCIPDLEASGVAERCVALPPRGAGYFRFFRRLRREYPDVYVVFPESFRADLEAWLAGAPQRFGLRRPGKKRPLLTHPQPPLPFDPGVPFAREAETFLRQYGLREPVLTDRPAGNVRS